jgi:endonuclease/exonuclease/phosphatase family metal-dependent hydrolase
VDLPATRTLAHGLGAGYVYYPANRHPKTRRQFGVAIVSRWPIRDDRKLLLARFDTSDDARKIALSATVWVRGMPVGFVDVHLQSGLSPVWLGDQLQLFALCLLSERCPQAGAPLLAQRERVVMAGDFNTRGTDHVHVAERVLGWSGFRRVSRLAKTMKWMPDEMGRIDHVFVRGALEAEAAGIVAGFFNLGSDHRPIWARLRLAQPPAERWLGFQPGNGEPPSEVPAEAGSECPEAGPWRGGGQ